MKGQPDDVANAVLNYRRALTAAPNNQLTMGARQALIDFQNDARTKLGQVGELLAANKSEQAAALMRQIEKDYANLPGSNAIQQTRGRFQRMTALASAQPSKTGSESSESGDDPEPVKAASLRAIESLLPARNPNADRDSLPAVKKLIGSLEQ
jgi:hypothetical protein